MALESLRGGPLVLPREYCRRIAERLSERVRRPGSNGEVGHGVSAAAASETPGAAADGATDRATPDLLSVPAMRASAPAGAASPVPPLPCFRT